MINVAANSTLNFDDVDAKLDASIYAAGNDTISFTGYEGGQAQFWGGDDTVVALGSATVYGGADILLFKQGLHATGGDTVYVGDGSATLYGGAQASTFFGSTSGASQVQMYAGTAGDTLVGGNGGGFEAMHGGAGIDHFQFDVINGGTGLREHRGNFVATAHLIYGFTEGQDVVDLVGYNASDVHTSVDKGGDTILKLSDGTVIKLMGDSHFNPLVDIKFH